MKHDRLKHEASAVRGVQLKEAEELFERAIEVQDRPDKTCEVALANLHEAVRAVEAEAAAELKEQETKAAAELKEKEEQAAAELRVKEAKANAAADALLAEEEAEKAAATRSSSKNKNKGKSKKGKR